MGWLCESYPSGRTKEEYVKTIVNDYDKTKVKNIYSKIKNNIAMIFVEYIKNGKNCRDIDFIYIKKEDGCWGQKDVGITSAYLYNITIPKKDFDWLLSNNANLEEESYKEWIDEAIANNEEHKKAVAEKKVALKTKEEVYNNAKYAFVKTHIGYELFKLGKMEKDGGKKLYPLIKDRVFYARQNQFIPFSSEILNDREKLNDILNTAIQNEKQIIEDPSLKKYTNVANLSLTEQFAKEIKDL